MCVRCTFSINCTASRKTDRYWGKCEVQTHPRKRPIKLTHGVVVPVKLVTPWNKSLYLIWKRSTQHGRAATGPTFANFKFVTKSENGYAGAKPLVYLIYSGLQSFRHGFASFGWTFYLFFWGYVLVCNGLQTLTTRHDCTCWCVCRSWACGWTYCGTFYSRWLRYPARPTGLRASTRPMRVVSRTPAWLFGWAISTETCSPRGTRPAPNCVKVVPNRGPRLISPSQCVKEGQYKYKCSYLRGPIEG